MAQNEEKEEYNILQNEIKKEIKVENMSEIYLSLKKMPNNPQNNQPNLKWFLTNEDALKNAKIIPIGLTNFTVDMSDDKYSFKFRILEDARDEVAKFSYKDKHDAEDKEDTPKKEITLKIKPFKIYDSEIFFAGKEDVESIEVNEISDVENDDVILEERKAKTIMIKGKKKQDYSWFIENYAEIKDKIFITNLANAQKGELKFKPKNVGAEQGMFEFTIKSYKFTEEKLPIIKLIFKKVEDNQNQNQNEKKKDPNEIQKEIKLIKKSEIEKNVVIAIRLLMIVINTLFLCI